MPEDQKANYKYRKWPLFVPSYLVFATVYFFFFYDLADFSYRSFAETAAMSIFVPTPLLFSYFELKIVKIESFGKLALELGLAWFISTAAIFLIMLTYFHGEQWFGAIAMLFFLFLYYLLAFLLAYLYFKISKGRRQNTHA